MTGPIPPWSPLNDPQLSAQIQGNLRHARESVRREAQFWQEVLTRHAWQEYPVKCGVWILGESGLTSGTNLSGPWTKRVWAPSFAWMQLYDPASRQPIAVQCANPSLGDGGHVTLPFDARTTSVWFAGDPRVCGLFSPVGDGHRAYFGERPTGITRMFSAWQKGPEYYAQWAAKVAAMPDRRPDGTTSIWIADHPQKPDDPRRFSKATL